MSEEIKNKWAVILGASSGTGAGIAKALAQHGMNIFGAHRGRYPEQAAEVERDVRATGQEMVMWVADVATPEGAEAGAAELTRIAGPNSVHMFVHSIASASLGHFVNGDELLHPRQIEKTFNAMAHSFIYWAQQLHHKELLSPNARLLALNNPLDTTHLHNTGAISASKAALEMYVQHLAMEMGPLGHRVNMLKFGTVMTSALQYVYSPETLARLEAAHRKMNPAGRMQTVEEVARFVCVLADNDAEWFNGATIDFTGGMNIQLLDIILNAERHK